MKKNSKKKDKLNSNLLQPLVVFCIVFFITLGFIFILTVDIPIQNSSLSALYLTSQITNQETALPTVTPTPISGPFILTQALNPPLINAESVLVSDLKSGAVLYSKDPSDQYWPASTTKLMTALVSLDQYKLDDVVTVGTPVVEGSKMNLQQGEKIHVENLLYGLLIQSANDAAFALADSATGGREAFVEKMNQKALELGLSNTHFTDPAGFDNVKQYTTAEDLSKLSRYALLNPTIKKMVAIPQITISDESYTLFHKLNNVNQLLGKVPGVAGIKTGWTENAKENLVNLTYKNGDGVLTVVLGSSDRFGETEKLTNWVFSSFVW